jgi:hypothetical protein
MVPRSQVFPNYSTSRDARNLGPFQLEDLPKIQTIEPDTPKAPEEQLFLAISHEAQMGSSSRRTIQFLGLVANVVVTMLVDSDSSASFLAASIADQLLQLQRTPVQAPSK